jgi:integrase/recombinase XerD
MDGREKARQLPLIPGAGPAAVPSGDRRPGANGLIPLSPSLPDQIADYLAHLARVGRARHTAEASRGDLEQLSTLLGGRAIDRVGEHDLEAAVALLRGRGQSTASLRRKVATIKAFFRYLRANQRLAVDPSAALIYPELPERSAEPLADDELRRLLDEPFAAPHRVLILLMSEAGLKREETLALTWADVELFNGSGRLWIRRALAAQRVRARSVPLTRLLAAVLREAAAERRSDERVVDLSTRGIDYVIREAGRRAGLRVGGKLTPQRLRDTFAVRFLTERLGREAALEDAGERRRLAAQHDAELAELLGLARGTLAVGRYRRAARQQQDRTEAQRLADV